MKKVPCILLVAVLLIGLVACSKAPTANQSADNRDVNDPTPVTTPAEIEQIAPEETLEPTPQPLSYSIYVPNDNADGFITETVRTEEISAEAVLTALTERNVLPDTVSLNRFSIDGGLITLDFNQAFADAVCSMGTGGELMIVGSVVNTFLDAFQAESVYFTVDDQILESGHTLYDFSISFVSVDPQSADYSEE